MREAVRLCRGTLAEVGTCFRRPPAIVHATYAEIVGHPETVKQAKLRKSELLNGDVSPAEQPKDNGK